MKKPFAVLVTTIVLGFELGAAVPQHIEGLTHVGRFGLELAGDIDGEQGFGQHVVGLFLEPEKHFVDGSGVPFGGWAHDWLPNY